MASQLGRDGSRWNMAYTDYLLTNEVNNVLASRGRRHDNRSSAAKGLIQKLFAAQTSALLA